MPFYAFKCYYSEIKDFCYIHKIKKQENKLSLVT